MGAQKVNGRSFPSTPPRWGGLVVFTSCTRGGIRHQPSYTSLKIQVSRSRPKQPEITRVGKPTKPSTNESYIHFWRRFAQGSLGRCHLQLNIATTATYDCLWPQDPCTSPPTTAQVLPTRVTLSRAKADILKYVCRSPSIYLPRGVGPPVGLVLIPTLNPLRAYLWGLLTGAKLDKGT